MLPLASPSGGHMSREVSRVVEQLIVFAKLLCRVERLHALRTDEALQTETHYQRTKQATDQTASNLLMKSENRKLPLKSDQVSDRGWGQCCWAARILRFESLPCRESAEKQHHIARLSWNKSYRNCFFLLQGDSELNGSWNFLKVITNRTEGKNSRITKSKMHKIKKRDWEGTLPLPKLHKTLPTSEPSHSITTMTGTSNHEPQLCLDDAEAEHGPLRLKNCPLPSLGSGCSFVGGVNWRSFWWVLRPGVPSKTSQHIWSNSPPGDQLTAQCLSSLEYQKHTECRLKTKSI